MKTRGCQILLLIAITFALYFMQSCKGEGDTECEPLVTTTYPISKKLRDSIPYSGYDTLTFVRISTGDTHIFVGQGLKEGYDLYSGGRTYENCPPPDNTKMGWLKYTFASSTFNSEIILGLYSFRSRETPYFAIDFNNQDYEDGSTALGKPYAYSSLQIAGQTFYNINKISNSEFPTTDRFFVLYNYSFGILKFKFTNGEEWELISKK